MTLSKLGNPQSEEKETMSSDKIEEIQAQHAIDERWRNGPSMLSPQSHDHRGYLLAEVERQARHIEELQSKIDAEKSCACSYDEPGDVCSAHSPAQAEAHAEIERLRAALKFYADRRSYKTATVHMSGHFVGQPVTIDGGEQARKALEDGR